MITVNVGAILADYLDRLRLAAPAGSKRRCPIALALQNAGFGFVTVEPTRWYAPGGRNPLPLSPELQAFVQVVDELATAPGEFVRDWSRISAGTARRLLADVRNNDELERKAR